MVDRLAAPAPDVRDEPVAASAMPSARARSAATANSRPSIGPSASVSSAAEAMCGAGMSRMWVGARGAMSRIATTRSSSWSRSAGISPATIRQNRQSVGDRSRRGASRHHSTGLELIRNPIVPTRPAIRYDT